MELLKRVLTAIVLIPVVLILILRGPLPVLAFVAGVTALLAVRELLKLSETYNIQPFRAPTLIYCALFFLVIASHAGANDALSAAAFAYFAVTAAALAPFIFLSLGMRAADLTTGFPAAMVSTVAFVYVALPLGSLIELREQWRGGFFVLYLLLLVWAGDIFAYFIGKPFGRHRMSPRISPNKTWEGAAASLAASIGVGVLMFQYAPAISSALLKAHLIERKDGIFNAEPSLLPVIALSAGLNIAAQLGDLVESLIKRGAGMKDSGAILPGHGGMLDRIDALLFAAPVLWCYLAWRVMMQ